MQYSKTVHDAVAFCANYLKTRAASKPLDVFIKEFNAEMQTRVQSGSLLDGALKAIKETFVKIVDRFGSTLLSEISTPEIKAWLKAMPVAPRTKERHRSYTGPDI